MIVIDEQEVKPPDSPKPSYLSGPDSMEWSGKIIAIAEDASDMRRRIGATALEMDAADDASQARWRDIVAARLPKHQWPRQRVRITAVNAETGEPIVFDSDSGVHLVDAVAASTSNGFGLFGPYRIAEHRYLDGGYRRSSNTDLAAGYGRVLVLDPFSGRSRHPLAWGMALATQVDELRTAGSIVETVFADARSDDVFNANALDPSTRLPAARGGYKQGRSFAENFPCSGSEPPAGQSPSTNG